MTKRGAFPLGCLGVIVLIAGAGISLVLAAGAAGAFVATAAAAALANRSVL